MCELTQSSLDPSPTFSPSSPRTWRGSENSWQGPHHRWQHGGISSQVSLGG